MPKLGNDQSFRRTTMRIPTPSGDELEAWVYQPEGSGPHPAVVMAHGLGAIKACGLAPFAERFCREGFVAIVFDYRQWGGSTGKPRDVLSVLRQRDDYGTVIDWAETNPIVDAKRIFAWGTSFAGMHIVALAASDRRLAGAVAQCPLVDGLAGAALVPPIRLVRLMGVALLERYRLGIWLCATILAHQRCPWRMGRDLHRGGALWQEPHSAEGAGRVAEPPRRTITSQHFRAQASTTCRRH
jgi:alpha-beta hydrolase superfamily lysophospholipase